MKKILGAVVGRIAGALVGALTGLAAAKGVGEISPASQEEIAVVIANAFMLIGYGIAHKLFDRKKAE